MSRLFGNTIYLTSAAVAQKILAFFYFALVARILGEINLGEYALFLAVIMTAQVLFDAGLSSVLVREVAKKPQLALEWWRGTAWCKLLILPVATGLFLFSPWELLWPAFANQSPVLIAIAIGIIYADTISQLAYAVLRGLQTTKFEAIGIAVGQLFICFTGTAFLLSGWSTLEALTLALLVGSVWNLIFSLFKLVQRLGASILVPKSILGLQPLRLAFMFFIAALAVKVYSFADSFILNHLAGPAAVGNYSVAFKLTNAFQFLPIALVGGLYPALSAELNTPDRLKDLLIKSWRYLSLIILPVSVGLSLYAEELIPFIFGNQFPQAAPVLAILPWLLWPLFWDYPIGSLLNAAGLQSKKTLAIIIALVVNIGLNLILIPEAGVVGAAIASIISSIVLLGVGAFFARSLISLSVKEINHALITPLLIGVVVWLFVHELLTVLPWILTWPFFAGAMLVGLYLTKTVTNDDIKDLVNRFKNRSVPVPSTN